MNRFYSFLLKLSICFLIGCKTIIPMSTERNQTLLVGNIVFAGNNYISRNGISFNGTTNSGIEIILKNTDTNELFRFSSGKNGLFYISLQEGKYRIDELYIKKANNDGAWAYIYTNPSNKLLEIEKGKVNNVGTIRWFFTDGRHVVEKDDNSTVVKNEFSKQFSSSNWNQKEWQYSPFVVNVIKPSGEQVSYYLKTDDGRDSTHLTLPKDMPIEQRQQIEADALAKMTDRRIQGDTTYYVKSVNGLDSVLIKRPKMMPEDAIRDVEERMRQNMRNR